MRSLSIRLTCSSILLSASLLTACGGSSSSSVPNSGDYITHAAASLSAQQALAHYLLIQDLHHKVLFAPGMVFNLSQMALDPADDTRCVTEGTQSTQRLDTEPTGWTGGPLTNTRYQWQDCQAVIINPQTEEGIKISVNGSAVLGVDQASQFNSAFELGAPGQPVELRAEEIQAAIEGVIYTRVNGQALLQGGTELRASQSSVLTSEIYNRNPGSERSLREKTQFKLSITGYGNGPFAEFEMQPGNGEILSARARVGYEAISYDGAQEVVCPLDGYVDLISSHPIVRPLPPQGEATFYLPSGDVTVSQGPNGFEVTLPQQPLLVVDEDLLAAAQEIVDACSGLASF
ncbi:hypothetical protein [Isoalcanivorax beigongshangi]|uniref:Uncharacterized protein n=1 Tax=Isoalcanivorax beigongshangi TaxID=3238810 RepID=A0ABV4AE88_9GAMM